MPTSYAFFSCLCAFRCCSIFLSLLAPRRPLLGSRCSCNLFVGQRPSYILFPRRPVCPSSKSVDCVGRAAAVISISIFEKTKKQQKQQQRKNDDAKCRDRENWRRVIMWHKNSFFFLFKFSVCFAFCRFPYLKIFDGPFRDRLAPAHNSTTTKHLLPGLTPWNKQLVSFVANCYIYLIIYSVYVFSRLFKTKNYERHWKKKRKQ